MCLSRKRNTPKQAQRGAETHNAKRGDLSWSDPTKPLSLEDRRVQQPYPDRRNHLQPRQGAPREKSTDDPGRVQTKPDPKQPGDGGKKIGQRRQVIKNRTQ